METAGKGPAATGPGPEATETTGKGPAATGPGPEPVVSVAFTALTPAGTARCGAALASLLRQGDVVLLGGELGAGKTTFTKGLAAALGVDEPVTSPTFVLVHSYPTRAGWDLLHADVWRLEQLQEIVDLAIPELLEDGAVAVIEWGEKAAPALPRDCLHVTIDFGGVHAKRDHAKRDHAKRDDAKGGQGAGDQAMEDHGAAGARRLELRAEGGSWRERLSELERLLAGSEEA